MTEEQRRALYALREALRLCEGHDIGIAGAVALTVAGTDDVSAWTYFGPDSQLLDDFLVGHPEP